MKNLLNFFLIVSSILFSHKLIELFIAKLKLKFIDIPNKRSMHEIPTPRGAGIIFSTFTILSSLIFIFLDGFSKSLIIPILCIPLALIGVLDDIYRIPSSVKYFFHITTSMSIILASNLLFDINFGQGYVTILVFISLTFCFTAFINFINFMDGIDGLVGGSMFISILTSCFVLKIGQPYLITLGSLSAFILYNWSPAKVFMGDTGSTFLAAINLGLISLSNNLSEASGLILILTPCLIDPLTCVIKRFSQNQNIFRPHNLHLYQRLKQNGFKDSNISLIYILMTTMLSIIFISFGVLATFITSIIVTMIGLYLDKKFALSFQIALNKISTIK